MQDKQQPQSQRPNSLDMAGMYERTMKMLARPIPAVRLPHWQHFNQIVGGFRMKEYSILCGPTGCGKTTFLANASAQLLHQGVPHFVMSVETGPEDYMARVISAISKYDVNTGDPIGQETLDEIHTRYGQMFLQKDKLQFGLYENRLTDKTLKFELEWHLKNKGCQIAFIDNFNFMMNPVSDSNWNLEMDRITHDLIMFVKQHPMHIVMVMHPNKANERVTHEFHIKGSSTAVQEAQNIFLLNPPDQEDIESGALKRWDRELLIKKMRRRGRYTGHKVIFTCQEATYTESGICAP